MAEDHVSRDEHRADIAGLRGELKEELAGVRQEVAVLAKTMEANQQAMILRFEQINQQMTSDREAMLLRFEQADQRHSDLLDAHHLRHVVDCGGGGGGAIVHTLLRFGLKPTP